MTSRNGPRDSTSKSSTSFARSTRSPPGRGNSRSQRGGASWPNGRRTVTLTVLPVMKKVPTRSGQAGRAALDDLAERPVARGEPPPFAGGHQDGLPDSNLARLLSKPTHVDVELLAHSSRSRHTRLRISTCQMVPASFVPGLRSAPKTSTISTPTSGAFGDELIDLSPPMDG